MPVTYDDLVRVARRSGEHPLPTIGGRVTFTAHVVGDSIFVVPTSTNKPRPCGAGTRKAIDHYNETGSMTPADYQHLTRNSDANSPLPRFPGPAPVKATGPSGN